MLIDDSYETRVNNLPLETWIHMDQLHISISKKQRTYIREMQPICFVIVETLFGIRLNYVIAIERKMKFRAENIIKLKIVWHFLNPMVSFFPKYFCSRKMR